MAVSKNPPLTPIEYREFISLDSLSKAERKGEKQQRYISLKFRYMLYLGKKRP